MTFAKTKSISGAHFMINLMGELFHFVIFVSWWMVVLIFLFVLIFLTRTHLANFFVSYFCLSVVWSVLV